MKKINLTLGLFACVLTVSAQDGSLAPKYSNEFLQIGVGARALGLGNALVAGVNDVTAAYWNPAGLTKVENNLEIGLMHSEYFAGIAKYDYLGIAHKIDEKSAVGFAAIRFGVDDIPNTTQLLNNEGNIDYDRVTLFTAADYGFLFSYARQTSIEGLSLGGNVKIVHRRAGDFARSWGFGIDAGAQYNYKTNWNFGVMARDVTSTFNAWIFNLDSDMQEVFLETGNEIPENGLELTLPRLILAAQRKINTGFKDIYVSPEINAVLTTDGRRNTLVKSGLLSIDPVFGLEIGWRDMVAIRTGLNNFQYVKNFDDSETLIFQPNLGVGVSFKGVTLDYAFTNIGNQSEALFSHVISLKFGFKEPFKK
ncbi:MAG: PorV/PorQ family protein [Brumimicrobium sp.]|nr:PorV/PorQ family protein [Brumimicrobium sp.]